MRANRPGIVLLALLVLLSAGQARAMTIQPKHDENYQGLASRSGQTVRPESADERIADYTEWLAFFTAALVVVSTVQIGYLIRADKTARLSAESASRLAEFAKLSAEIAVMRKEGAERTGEAQVRAYVSIKRVDIGFIAEIMSQPFVEFVAANSGQSPALNFLWNITVQYITASAKQVCSLNVGWLTGSGMNIPASSDSTPERAIITPMTIKNFLQGANHNIGAFVIRVRIEFRYTDVFGKEWFGDAYYAGLAKRVRPEGDPNEWEAKVHALARPRDWADAANGQKD
jgi:hypothetical protein